MQHFFDVTLQLAPPPEPEPPGWWPQKRFSGYGGEKLKVTAAGIAPPERELDGGGRLYVGGIPAGSAKVEFAELLKSVKVALDEGSKYAVGG